MDQTTAQSNQAEIVNYAIQLKKEQIEAYFNQKRLFTNQSNDNLLNQNQITTNNQQFEQQFNLNNQSINRLSPLMNQQLIKKIITSPNESDKLNVLNPYINSYITQSILNDNTQFSNRNDTIALINHQIQQQQQQQQQNNQTTSAFRPVRRKDSIYSLNSLDSKRLANNQKLIDSSFDKTIDFSEQNDNNQKIRLPKKSFNSSFRRSSPTNQLTNNRSSPYSRHISLDVQRNNFLIANQFQSNPTISINSPSPSSFHRPSSNSPLNNSLNSSSLSNKDFNQPIDMTKSNQLKIELLNESQSKKTKLIKDANDIGQYINKIISENEAIVEISEPKLLKRNSSSSSRNSTTNLPNLQQFKHLSSSSSSLAAKNQHRINRSISVIQTPYQLQQNYNDFINNDRLNHDSPKLVSALRGQLEINSPNNLIKFDEQQQQQLQQNNFIPNSLNNSLYSLYQQNQYLTNNTKFSNRKLSDGNYLYANNKNLDNNLDNSFMKNFLTSSTNKTPTIKVTPPCITNEDSNNCLNNSKNNSSIIKDLLLVNKDNLNQQIDNNNNDLLNKNDNLKTNNKNDEQIKNQEQEELSCLVYVCTICNIAFRNKETLNAHQTHYCKNNLSTPEVNRLTDVSKDDLILNNNNSKDALGNILKQHLLHPNSNQNLIKKRKISEPTFSSSSLNNHSLFLKDSSFSFKSSANSFLNELNRQADNLSSSVSKDNAVYFSNFGLGAQQNVARKISVLHPANRPYFITIKQPLFEHDHLMDFRQIPGLPSQLNNQHFQKDNSNLNLLKSEHNNSITNLTDTQSIFSNQSSIVPIQTTSSTITTSELTNDKLINKNSTNSSHKLIDQVKDYTLITDYLKHYDRKITVKGNIQFQILNDTLELEGDKAGFKHSNEKDDSSKNSKYIIYNNQIKQTSSMPMFMSDQQRQNNSISPKGDTSLSNNVSTSVLTTSISTSVSSISCLPNLSTLSDVDNSNDKESDKNNDNNKQKSKDNKTPSPKLIPSPRSISVSPKLTTEPAITKRPANLFNGLLKKPNQLICSNLDSPDTPRSEKTIAQCYLNGQLYTYLAIKRTTRVTFCSIFRPQPSFIEQSIDPKLSMYSNWQIQPPFESILNEIKAPVLMSCYDSRQWKHRSCYYTSLFATPFSITIKDDDFLDNDNRTEINKLDKSDDIQTNKLNNEKSNSDKSNRKNLIEEYLDNLKQINKSNGCTMIPTFYCMMKKFKQDRINIRIKLKEFRKKFVEESSDLTERLLKRRQRKLSSRKISDDQSINNHLDNRNLTRKQSSTNQPKRIYIFEGGFKSNEDYTYVRGRGRGKYVCVECGIRCKKPSMLRKHIRTHSDVRPYTCKHCSFAFKTKGNLQKHMKSASHHKKCAELGISPIPTTIDTNTQIDTNALAIQEAMERASNQPTYDLDDYDEDDLDDLDDYSDEQLDAKFLDGNEESGDEDEEDEDLILNETNNNDLHLHITGLKIISNNFCLNKNDPCLDTSNTTYLGVNIGCLTNFKRLSSFSDVILPNATELNDKGNEKLNKFSIILEALNSPKTPYNYLNDNNINDKTNTDTSIDEKIILISKKNLIDNKSSSPINSTRLFNQQITDSTSLEVVKLTDNNSTDLSKTQILDNNNNLINFNRARLIEENSNNLHQQQQNTIRHKHSLIGGVNSNSLASIPECLEELENKKEDNFMNLDLDGNYNISRIDSYQSELKRRNKDADDDKNKKMKNDNYEKENSINKLIIDYDSEKKNNFNSSNDDLIYNQINDKDNQKLMSESFKKRSINSTYLDYQNYKKIAIALENSTAECDNIEEQITLTTEEGKKDVISNKNDINLNYLNKSQNESSTNKEILGNVGGVNMINEQFAKLNELEKRIDLNFNLKTKSDQFIKSDYNHRRNYLDQLTKDSIPKVNLDHKLSISNRSKSLPPQILNSNQLKLQLDDKEEESRSSSVNSNMKITEYDEHEVAHSLLSLSRNWTSDAKLNRTHQVTFPIKRKISQEFFGAKFHHGNYDNIRNNNRSPTINSPDEEVRNLLKKNSTSSKLEHNWANEDWKLNERLKRIKNQISNDDNSKLNEKINDESNVKLSDKLAKIKSLETQIDITKSLDDNDDIQKLLQKVDPKLIKNDTELNSKNNELDLNKLSIHIQNTIDEHERILNNGPLTVNSTSTSNNTSSNSVKSPVDHSRTNVCNICNKAFSEESQLKLHENIHYFERPFRCEICSVSFRSSGHLQKHIRSASHQDKLSKNSTFGQPSVDNPRPFRCDDCKTSFRIFGHLSKHLRSKIHINKLESLGKLPIGLYSLMERNRIQLNELDTTDCETSLLCLKKLAQRLQANGDLPVSSNLNLENYSTTSQSICSSAFCESSGNEDSNLSSSKSIDEKNHQSANYLNENSSSNPSILQNVQFTNDLYSKVVATTLNNQLVSNPSISLFNNSLLPISQKMKQVNLIPSYLIDNYGLFSNHYIPQQQFYDQNTCKHPHHLYAPSNKQNIELHGFPLPKPTPIRKQNSPEINILEDSNESSRSSIKLEEDKKINENKKLNNSLNEKVPISSSRLISSPIQSVSPKPNSLSKIATSTSVTARSSSPNFASIQLNSNTCSICNQVFKSAKFLQVHLYSEHQNKPIACSSSSSKDQQDQNLIKNEKSKSNEFECKICGKILNDLDQFKTHFLVHSVPRPFICEICDAGFTTSALLASHLKTHES